MQQLPLAPTALEHNAQLLGQPCRNVNALKAMLYPDPRSGRTLLVVNSCTPGFRGAALFIDYETGDKTVVPMPIASGGWDIVEIAPNRLLFESLAPLHLVPIDLQTMAVDTANVVPVPQSEYAWRFTKGPDGWIYFGSYPTCHAYRFNSATNTVEDLGRMGPEGNTYVRHIAVNGDGNLLCSVMAEKTGLVLCDIQTGATRWLFDCETVSTLLSVGGTVYGALEGRLMQFDSATKLFKEPELPTPPGVHWTAILDSSTPSLKLVKGSDEALYAVEGEAAPRKIWTLPLRGGRIVGLDPAGNVVGVRGQEYFVAEPLATTIDPKPLADNPPPVAIHCLRADPRGGVTGGPTFGQTLFRFDPARGLQQNTPQVVDGGGEVYDGHWIDDKFYFVAYAGGELAVWDPAIEWDQWGGANPKLLVQYNAEEFGGLIRPQGHLAIGPGGRLYAGWSAHYGTTRGGISEYDIAAGKARAWSSDLVAPEVSIGAVAADDRLVYGVTRNQFNGLTRPLKPIIFFAFDPATEEVVFRQTLDKVTGTACVIHVPDTNQIWLAGPEGVQRFDRQTLRLLPPLPWPPGVEAPTVIRARAAHGRRAWFGVGKTVVQINDGDRPTVTTLFTAPEHVDALAANERELYFTMSTELWRTALPN